MRTRLRIDADGRFIEDQHGRSVHQRDAKVQASLHTARVPARCTLRTLNETDPFENLIAACGQFSTAQSVQAPKELEVLDGIEVWIDREVLRDDSQPSASVAVAAIEWEATQNHFARIGS